jgi:hypothetical protein
MPPRAAPAIVCRTMRSIELLAASLLAGALTVAAAPPAAQSNPSSNGAAN